MFTYDTSKSNVYLGPTVTCYILNRVVSSFTSEYLHFSPEEIKLSSESQEKETF